MPQTKKEIGQRGKSTEKQVQDILDLWNQKKLEFAYERLPDARAARGAIKAQVADFMIGIMAGHPAAYKQFILLEVKESKHECRLAKDKIAQLPRIKKWVRACATGLVLVHHTETRLWRLVNADDLEIGKPSWDLTPYPVFDTPWAALVSHHAFREFKVELDG